MDSLKRFSGDKADSSLDGGILIGTRDSVATRAGRILAVTRLGKIVLRMALA